MNIGIVTVWGDRGSTMVSKAYIDLMSSKHNIYIYSRGGEREIRYSDSKKNVWQAKETYIPITTHIDKSDFTKWVTLNQIKIVLFNEQHWFEPLIWLKKLSITSLAYIDYYTEETLPLYKLYDGVICNTNRHYQAFKEHPNALYLPWGLNTELFTPSQNSADVYKTTFFHSCGMNPLRKGCDLLLQSTMELKGDFELIIHSQINLYDYYKDDPTILKCIENLVAKGKLRLITKSVKAPGLYKLGNVYVYPCRLDGLGLTVPEALSSGLPTIVPNAEPMRDFISPACSLVNIDRFYCRKDGYYWPQQLCDIDDLTKKMQSYISQGDIKNKMQQARAHAVQNLNWLNNSSILEKYINDIDIIPIDNKTIENYSRYKNYGYRKVFTKIEKFKILFTPLYFLYSKIKAKV